MAHSGPDSPPLAAAPKVRPLVFSPSTFGEAEQSDHFLSRAGSVQISCEQGAKPPGRDATANDPLVEKTTEPSTELTGEGPPRFAGSAERIEQGGGRAVRAGRLERAMRVDPRTPKTELRRRHLPRSGDEVARRIDQPRSEIGERLVVGRAVRALRGVDGHELRVAGQATREGDPEKPRGFPRGRPREVSQEEEGVRASVVERFPRDEPPPCVPNLRCASPVLGQERTQELPRFGSAVNLGVGVPQVVDPTRTMSN